MITVLQVFQRTAPIAQIQKIHVQNAIDDIVNTEGDRDPAKELADAKDKAKEELDRKAEEAKGAIDSRGDLTDEEKQQLKDRIDEETERASSCALPLIELAAACFVLCEKQNPECCEILKKKVVRSTHL